MNAQRREATGLSIFSKVLLQYHAPQTWNSLDVLQGMSRECAAALTRNSAAICAKPFFGGREDIPKRRLDIKPLDQTTECDHADISQRAQTANIAVHGWLEIRRCNFARTARCLLALSWNENNARRICLQCVSCGYRRRPFPARFWLAGLGVQLNGPTFLAGARRFGSRKTLGKPLHD